MSVLGRLRRRPSPGSVDAGWDDADLERVAGQAAALAAAWDPDPADVRVTASRAAVLGAFAAATSEVAGAADRPSSAAGAAPGYRRGGRRPAFVLVAAAMLLAMSVGAVAASAPGGPLYDLRVDAEAVILPAEPGQRAAAQVDRLQRRVAEATAAAARSDAAATRAALRAYARIATQAAGGATVDPQTAARVRAQLEVVLRLGAGDPSLVAAREQVRVAARLLLGALGDPGDVPGDGPGPGPTPGPGGPGPATPAPGGTTGPGGPSASPGPGSSAGPGPSAGPPGGQGSPAPSPAGSGGPGPSAGPGRTPAPEPTPKPTPRATASPSPTSGGGSAPGGPGGPTPSPSGGSGSGGGAGGTP
jgi:uncharacterized membrane protein YgcG